MKVKAFPFFIMLAFIIALALSSCAKHPTYQKRKKKKCDCPGWSMVNDSSTHQLLPSILRQAKHDGASGSSVYFSKQMEMNSSQDLII